MRILRLVDEGNFAVEFHPYITVVAETSDERRRSIVEAFEHAAAGRTTGLSGLIEVHGVVLDLDDGALGLLELEDGEIEITVVPGDLPGSASSGVGRQVRSAERRLEALEQPHRDRALALAAAEEALASALEAESAALAVAEQPVEPPEVDSEADRARDALVQRRADLQLERDRLFAMLDPDAAHALDEALVAVELASDTARAAEEEAASVAETPSPETADVNLIEERLGDLRAALALHRLYDPGPVREALDEVRAAHATGETVASTEALSLADRIDALDREIAVLDSAGPDVPSSALVDAAADRVERARVALVECERQLTSGSGGTEDIARLEEAHTSVELARDGLDSRFGRAKAQERLDLALAAEAELLERLGLGSYTEFLTHGGSAGPSQGSTQDVEAARAEVAEAEAEAEALVGTVDAALAQAQLVEERRSARAHARALLDDSDIDDDAIIMQLLNHRVPADDTGPRAGLLGALAAVGLPLEGLDVSDAEVETMAADWLAEHQHSESRLSRDIETTEAQLAERRADESGSAPPLDPVDDQMPELIGAVDPVADAHEAVRIAKDRVVAHESTAAQLAETEAALTAVDDELLVDSETEPAGVSEDDAVDPAVALAAAAESAEAARAAVADSAEALDHMKADYDVAVQELAGLRQTVSELEDEPPPVSEIEWYLLARLAAQRQQSFVGSLPLVISGALDAVADDEGLVHLLDRLERMAGAVQIVHITDDPRILSWADALADDRAAVVRPVLARSDTN